MRLTPINDTFTYEDAEGRLITIYGTYEAGHGGLLIHGRNFSKGCIVIGRNRSGDPIRTLIGNSGDNILRVIP